MALQKARSFVFFGTCDTEYPRNRNAIADLRSRGSEMKLCTKPLLRFASDGGNLAGTPLRRFLFCLKAGMVYPWLLARLLMQLKGVDALWVGTMGQLDVLIVWPLKTILRLPLTFDPLVSLYDTIVSDRGLLAPSSLLGHLLWGIDWLAFHAADRILIDTHAHRDFLVKEFGLNPEDISVIPLKANASFHPKETREPRQDRNRFIVLFHGKFIPLHGFEKILRAQAIVERETGDRIILRIAGQGQTYREMRELAASLRLRNLEWLGWIPHEEMPSLIHRADLCLGIFGDSDKAKRVVPNKVWEALACGKRVISQIMPQPERDPLLEGVRFVPPTPEAIAEAIKDEWKQARPLRESERIAVGAERIKA